MDTVTITFPAWVFWCVIAPWTAFGLANELVKFTLNLLTWRERRALRGRQ